MHTVYQRINASTQPSQPYDYSNLMDPLHWVSHLSAALHCLALDRWRIYSQFKFTPFAGHNISVPPFLQNNNDKTETKTTAWCRSQGGCISIYKCIQLKNYKMHQQPNFAPRCTFLIITSLHYTSCMEYCELLLLFHLLHLYVWHVFYIQISVAHSTQDTTQVQLIVTGYIQSGRQIGWIFQCNFQRPAQLVHLSALVQRYALSVLRLESARCIFQSLHFHLVDTLQSLCIYKCIVGSLQYLDR